MNTAEKNEKSEKTGREVKAEKETKLRKERMVHSAQIKCQTVLALWTGRRRLSELCRELNVPANLIMGWQERALEGMLTTLEPRTRRQEDRGPILADRLQRMLERKAMMLGNRMARLNSPGRPPKGAQDKAPANAN
jgi:transposase-like protein